MFFYVSYGRNKNKKIPRAQPKSSNHTIRIGCIMLTIVVTLNARTDNVQKYLIIRKKNKKKEEEETSQ